MGNAARAHKPGYQVPIGTATAQGVLTAMLTLRPTGLSSPAYRDLVDYIVIQDNRAVGRIYEDRQTLPDLPWFWSITMYVDPNQGITPLPVR